MRSIPETQHLLEAGEDPNTPIRSPTGTPKDYYTVMGNRVSPLCQYPIEAACSMGDLTLVKLLLAYGAMLKGTNCLHTAAGGQGAVNPQEQLDTMNFLLNQGLNINKVQFADDPAFPLRYGSRSYGTPLHYAAEWEYVDRVELLVERGADQMVKGWDYVANEVCGTALEWHLWRNECDGHEFNRRIRELLSMDVKTLKL